MAENTFDYMKAWGASDSALLADKINKYAKRMGIDASPIIAGLNTNDRSHLMLMFFMIGLEFKGMVAKPLSDVQIMEKGARKFFRALRNRSHASKWDNDNNEYLGASYYVCIDPGLVHLYGNIELDSTLATLWNYYLTMIHYTQIDTGDTYCPYIVSIVDDNGVATKYHWISVRLDKRKHFLRSAIKLLMNRGYVMPSI